MSTIGPLVGQDPRWRATYFGFQRTLRLMAHLLADLEAQDELAVEEHLALAEMCDVLAYCEMLIRRLQALEREKAAHAAELSASRLN